MPYHGLKKTKRRVPPPERMKRKAAPPAKKTPPKPAGVKELATPHLAWDETILATSGDVCVTSAGIKYKLTDGILSAIGGRYSTWTRV